jgi:hypothetical protein
MIPRSFSSLRFAAVALAVLALAGCATRKEITKQVVRYAPAANGQPGIAGALVRRPETVAELASIDPSVPAPPARSPLARMIDGMILGIDTDGYILIQRRNARPIAVDQSLYQDAIALTTLRGRLHRLNGLDSRIIEQARVRQGAAFLDLPGSTSLQSAADAINAALDTRGITQVRARIPHSLIAG